MNAALVINHCPVCELTGGPFLPAEATQMAGRHDDLHHHGQPTAQTRPAQA